MATESGDASLGHGRTLREVGSAALDKVKENKARVVKVAAAAAALLLASIPSGRGSGDGEISADPKQGPPGVVSSIPMPEGLAGVITAPHQPTGEQGIPVDNEQRARDVRQTLEDADEAELAALVTAENLPGSYDVKVGSLTTHVVDFMGLDRAALTQEISAVDGLNGQSVRVGSNTGRLELPVFRTHGKGGLGTVEHPVINRYLITGAPGRSTSDPDGDFKVFLANGASVKAVVGKLENGESPEVARDVARVLAGAYIVRVDGVSPGSAAAVDAAFNVRSGVIDYLGDLAGAVQGGRPQSDVQTARPDVKVNISGLPTSPLIRVPKA